VQFTALPFGGAQKIKITGRGSKKMRKNLAIIVLMVISIIGLGCANNPTGPSSVNTLIPSDTFASFSVIQGDSNPESYTLHLTNSSSASVSFTVDVPDQPIWYNVVYNTQTMTLNSGGVMGVGISVDATKVSTGTYTANLIVSGNFNNSPITIPVTLTVYTSSHTDGKG
jgi:hypothetical protein